MKEQKNTIENLQNSINELSQKIGLCTQILKKSVSSDGKSATITVDDGYTTRYPALVIMGTQAGMECGAAVFTPATENHAILGGTLSMSKSGNTWTVTGVSGGWGILTVIGHPDVISHLS